MNKRDRAAAVRKAESAATGALEAPARALSRYFEAKLSAAELACGIDRYFERCEELGRKPTKPGLCNALGITTKTLDNYLAKGEEDLERGGGRYMDYVFPIKKAMQRIGDELEQRTDTMALFLLKQPSYGGYSDRADLQQQGNLSITLQFGDVHKNVSRNYGK